MNKQHFKGKVYRRMGVSLSLVILIIAIPLHSDKTDRTFMVVNSGLYTHGTNNEILSQDFWSKMDNFTNQSKKKGSQNKRKIKKIVVYLQIICGTAMGYLSVRLLGPVGASIGASEGGFGGAVLGAGIGITFATALGVYVVGSSSEARGSFGKTLLGSFLGCGIASLTGALMPSDLGSDAEKFVQMLYFIIPAICATTSFNRSSRSKRSQRPGSLFNVSSKKFRMGIPHVQVNVLPNFRNKYKPVFRFNVRLLSFEL